MRSFVRHHRLGITLSAIGLALVLIGTGASLGYQALVGDSPADVRSARETSPATGGMSLDATLDLATPYVPVDPVSLRTAPRALKAAPLPGFSVDRNISLDRAGLGADLDLDLASGSHRGLQRESSDQGMTKSSTRAVLTPATEVAAVAAGAFALAGIIAYFWGALKTWSTRLALAPALALYAKITRAEVFDNSVRERIFTAIRDHPGRSASDLSRLAAVSWGTTIYHLDVLEQTRMVSSLRKGRYRRYFENGAELSATKDTVAILQNPVTAGVVERIRATPGATQKELAAATNMTPQALHWHLARLVEVGCVRKEREGRVVRHFTQAN